MNNQVKIFCGNCLDVMKTFDDNSVDSIVTDPPYGLKFMSSKWDIDVPSEEIWRECLRILKPGGHLLSFAGTRTQHRMATRIEDAGFEIRDLIFWTHAQGFPKNVNISKAIDKITNTEKNAICDIVSNENSKQWEGWGTSLKPSVEPITVARKPFSGTVANNVLTFGTGAINIDGCRVPIDPIVDASQLRTMNRNIRINDDGWGMSSVTGQTPQVVNSQGRWPTNFIHDGSDEILQLFPSSKGQQGDIKGTEPNNKTNDIFGEFSQRLPSSKRVSLAVRSLPDTGHPKGCNDAGSAARFFYCAKTSRSDRHDGCELPEKIKHGSTLRQIENHIKDKKVGNHHLTVKPTDLMRYLCRLVTPPGGTVLDPFMGSGSTLKAATLEGFNSIGIELDQEYVTIAQSRVKHTLDILNNNLS